MSRPVAPGIADGGSARPADRPFLPWKRPGPGPSFRVHGGPGINLGDTVSRPGQRRSGPHRARSPQAPLRLPGVQARAGRAGARGAPGPRRARHPPDRGREERVLPDARRRTPPCHHRGQPAGVPDGRPGDALPRSRHPRRLPQLHPLLAGARPGGGAIGRWRAARRLRGPGTLREPLVPHSCCRVCA